MIPKVYILFGRTGEYADHRVWTVACYTNREQAELHREAAQNKTAELRPMYQALDRESIRAFRNPYDPYAHEEANGHNGNFSFGKIKYFIMETDLVRHLDEWTEEVQSS